MSDTPPPAARPGWLRVGFADIVFIVISLGILITTRDGALDDPGVGWHIRQVEVVWLHGGWLTHDLFSGPRGGQPWLINQWIGEHVLWLGDWWAGLNGLAVVTTLISAFVCRNLYGMLRADGLTWPVAFLWTWLAAFASFQACQARPNLFTFWFVLLTARMCDLYHRGLVADRRLLWLLPLFAVWANAHGGFVAGFIILGVSFGVEAGIAVLSFEPEARAAGRRRAQTFAGIGVGCLLATLVNPYGWRLYPWIFKLLGDQYFMNLNDEWQSPNFHMTGAYRYELLMLLFPTLLAFSRHRSSLVNLGLSIAWLHYAFGGMRMVPLWVVVTVPLMGRLSTELPWFQEALKRLQLSDDMWQLLRRPPGRPAYAGTIVFCLGLVLWARLAPEFAGHYPERIPTKALDRFLEEAKKLPPDRVAFHNHNWGGYLTWKGWPEFKTWADDRNELQGQEHIDETRDILSAREGWEDKLRHYKIDLVCVPTAGYLGRLHEYLAVNPEWELVYVQTMDDPSGPRPVAAIYRRKPTGVAR